MSVNGGIGLIDVRRDTHQVIYQPVAFASTAMRRDRSDMVGRCGGKLRSQNGGGRKRRKKGKENFGRYIYQVLKQVHHDVGISTKAINVMNSMMYDIMERIASESSRLVKITKRNTLSSNDIQTATKLVLGGELGKHAVSEGMKAIVKFSMKQ